jgi:hypothetical protein
MGLLSWIREHRERRRVAMLDEESTLSAQDRAAIESFRESRIHRGLDEMGDPRRDPDYIDPGA